MFIKHNNRFAGVKVLHSLIARAGRNDGSGSSRVDREKQLLILEAILPYKEDMLRLLRSSLADSEAKVTALSSDCLAGMSGWP